MQCNEYYKCNNSSRSDKPTIDTAAHQLVTNPICRKGHFPSGDSCARLSGEQASFAHGAGAPIAITEPDGAAEPAVADRMVEGQRCASCDGNRCSRGELACMALERAGAGGQPCAPRSGWAAPAQRAARP